MNSENKRAGIPSKTAAAASVAEKEEKMKNYGCTIEKDSFGNWKVYGADGFPLYTARTKREAKDYLKERIEELERVTQMWDKESQDVR